MGQLMCRFCFVFKNYLLPGKFFELLIFDYSYWKLKDTDCPMSFIACSYRPGASDNVDSEVPSGMENRI
mgnify:CR=1 FL=1